MKDMAVVVIIAHKSVLSDAEKASLRQCYKILGTHPIRLICPEGLDVSVYYEINPEAKIIFIDPKWQSDYRMFNELKMSLFFYQMFSQYKFILFYELDAWVFRDEVDYWCKKGYDYIGAPWFDGYGIPVSAEFIPGGNGGFSLRKVQTAVGMLNRIEQLKKMRRFWYKSRMQGLIRFEKLVTNSIFPFSIKNKDHLRVLLFREEYKMNEDYFWSYIIPKSFSHFRVAPVNEAVKFSIEAQPGFLYHQNGKTLPFGCHAWEKYEPEFWVDFININA